MDFLPVILLYVMIIVFGTLLIKRGKNTIVALVLIVTYITSLCVYVLFNYGLGKKEKVEELSLEGVSEFTKWTSLRRKRLPSISM